MISIMIGTINTILQFTVDDIANLKHGLPTHHDLNHRSMVDPSDYAPHGRAGMAWSRWWEWLSTGSLRCFMMFHDEWWLVDDG